MRMEVDILVRGPFAATQITVRYCALEALDPEINAHIDTQWRRLLDEARREGRILFNNPVAFLKNCTVADGILYLDLAPTDFKTFLVSTLRNREFFTLHAPAAMTPALGNSILLTYGNTAYLGVRSAAVAAYPHWAHLFGGVLDWPVRQNNNATVLLDHLYRELQEELGLNAKALSAPPRALAILRDPALGQPELVWHGELKNPLEIRSDALNAQEHDAILPVILEPNMAGGPPRTPISTAAIRMVTGRRKIPAS